MSTNITRRRKRAGTARFFVFYFGSMREVRAGETLSSPTVSATPSGLTLGTPEVLTTTFDDINSGKGVRVFISGGTPGTTYTIVCSVTTSGGATLEIAGSLEIE